MSRRLHVDWTACDGRGLCVELLPELLVEDDWGYPVARAGAVRARGAARPAPRRSRAGRSCPAQALRLLEPSDPSQPVRVTPHGPAGRRAHSLPDTFRTRASPVRCVGAAVRAGEEW